MVKQIHIHTDAFDRHVNRLERAMANVNSRMHVQDMLDYTNIEPYINDLENVTKMLQVLNDFKTIFQTDSETLASIGTSLKEQDEKLAETYRVGINNGVQPLS